MSEISFHLDLRIKELFSLLDLSIIKLLLQGPRSLALLIPDQEQAPHPLLGDQRLPQDQRPRMKDLVSLVFNIIRDHGAVTWNKTKEGITGVGLILRGRQVTLLVNYSPVPSLQEMFVKCGWEMNRRNDPHTCWTISVIVSYVHLKNFRCLQRDSLRWVAS